MKNVINYISDGKDLIVGLRKKILHKNESIFS